MSIFGSAQDFGFDGFKICIHIDFFTWFIILLITALLNIFESLLLLLNRWSDKYLVGIDERKGEYTQYYYVIYCGRINAELIYVFVD